MQILKALKIRNNFSFLKFAQTLSTVQNVSSTNEKVNIITDFIKSLQKQQKQQTKILFDFVHQKIPTGISDKILINHFTGKKIKSKTNQQNISKNKETINIIDQYLKKDNQSKNIQIKQINNSLIMLTQISGAKSIQRKLSIINQTMDNLSFLENKIFLRILTKNLKIGMKKTLIDKACSQSLLQNNSSEPFLKINKVSFNAMLAKPLRDMQEFDKFCSKKQAQIIADIKYDGERTIINYQKGKKIQLISRNGKEQNIKYYKIAEQIQKSLQNIQNIQSCILDAQIIPVNKTTKQPLPFQVLLTRRKKVELDFYPQQNVEQNIEQIVYAFDIISLNGQNLYEKPLIQRKQLIIQSGIIKKGQFKIFKYPIERQNILEYFRQIVSRKYEGLILKGINDSYVPTGSRIHWGKVKKGFKQKKQDKGQIDLDLVIMGADYGKGKNQKIISSFLLGLNVNDKIVPISKVGTGFSQQDLEELNSKLLEIKIKSPDPRYEIPKFVKMDVWIPPKYLMQIQCQQYSRSPLYEFGFREGYGGISLRFPVFKCMRYDKGINQTTEASQIIQDMNKQQGTNKQKVKQSIKAIIEQKNSNNLL